jgi:hypothetical protein
VQPLAPVHQFFEQFHEQLAVEPHFVADKPEGAFDVYHRDGANLLLIIS